MLLFHTVHFVDFPSTEMIHSQHHPSAMTRSSTVDFLHHQAPCEHECQYDVELSRDQYRVYLHTCKHLLEFGEQLFEIFSLFFI